MLPDLRINFALNFLSGRERVVRSLVLSAKTAPVYISGTGTLNRNVALSSNSNNGFSLALPTNEPTSILRLLMMPL